MSLQTRLDRIVLDLEELRADCHFSNEKRDLVNILEELRDISLYSDEVR